MFDLFPPSDDPALSHLDPGEQSAIVLAQSEAGALLLIDDAAGRLEASRRGIQVRALLIPYWRQTGLTNPPLPVTSHTATRAHFQPLALARHSKVLLPNSRVFASSMMSRCVV